MQQQNTYYNQGVVQHTSILHKTNYRKLRPNLKRHYPEEWGRFLDNHYDPQTHHKPFTVAMKAPDFKYRYSQGVGLSYKFLNNQVLEKLDVEKQNDTMFKFVRFEEFNSLKDGEVMISIEHCVNCHEHNTSTKHDEAKYKAFALNLQGAIREQFPQVQVIVKPIATDQDEKVKHLKIDFKKEQTKPTIIDAQMKGARLGAFEVQIFKKQDGRFIEQIIHSKLKSGLWPTLSQILEKIHFFLPQVPRVEISLFYDNHPGDEADRDFKFEGFKVSLKTSYSSTLSQSNLNQFLLSEKERLKQQSVERNKRLLGQNNSFRPQSAKTIIGGMSGGGQGEPLNQVSLFKTQNQYYQKNFQSYTTLPNVRPMSASTYQQVSQRSFDNIQNALTLHAQPNPYGVSQTLNPGSVKMKRPSSAYTNITKASRASRPGSAHTRKSIQVMSGLKREGRGLGYFGDDDDKIKDWEKKKQHEQNMKVQSQEKETNADGRVTYTDIPVGMYTVEVQGTDEFQPTVKRINVINEEEKDQIVIFVGVRPRIDSDIEFKFINSSNKEQIGPEKIEARAILLPNDKISQEDLEEYEFDILWNNHKKLWVATLISGSYLISIRGHGYRECNQKIDLVPGQREFSFEMTPLDQFNQQLVVMAVDVFTNQPVKNVFLELWKENSQLPVEGLTNNEGYYIYSLKQIGIHQVTVNKSGYIPMAKKFNFTEGLIKTSEQVVITIPMIKDFDHDKAYGILTYDGKMANCQLLAKSLTGEDVQVQKISTGNIFVCEVDVRSMQGYTVEEESPDKRDQERMIPAVRFWANIQSTEMLQINPATLDRNFKNSLQDCNLQFTLIFKNPSTGGQVQIFNVEAPSCLGGPIWDICFFSNPDIIQMNVLLPSFNASKADLYYSYYRKLMVFMRNRKTLKFSQVFEFDSKGVFRMDDMWLDEYTLVKILESQLGDKLWSHDQKKMFQKVQLRKEPEQKLTEIYSDVQKFYQVFARSLKNVFGQVSYKKLQEYLDRL